MSLDDHKGTLTTSFSQPGSETEAPYVTEIKFKESWDLYEWRGQAHKAAYDMNMPIKMRTEDGFHLEVSTLQKDGFERLVDAMKNGVPENAALNDPNNAEPQDHEGFDYNDLLDGVNRFIPR